MRVSDTRQLFRYVERRDRRQPLNNTHACSPPLVCGGKKIYGTQEKCELIAEYFEERFRAPPCASKGGEEKQRIFLQTWNRWQTTKTIPAVGELEVLKAAGGLEGNKAAGPDELPIEVFQHMPSALGMVSKLFTSILRTGKFPYGKVPVLLFFLSFLLVSF